MTRESRISPFVRPALLFTVAMACFGVAFLAGAIELVKPGLGIRFGNAVTQVMRNVPDGYLQLFGLMFSTYALGKSGERIVKAHSSAKNDPAKSDGDNILAALDKAKER